MGYYGLGREYEVEYRYDKREEYTGSDILGGDRQNGANGGQYQEGQDFIITSGGEEADCGIVVRGGEHKITFDNVNISRKQETADAVNCFAVTRINAGSSVPRVYLTLTGNNTFYGIGSAVLVGMPDGSGDEDIQGTGWIDL